MAIVWDWRLPAVDKLVALKLGDCADDNGSNSYPAVMTIAKACGLSRRGTQKVLERLLKRGCIEVQTGHTSRRSTTYRVCIENDIRGGWGERGAPLEANDVHPRGEPGAPLEANDVHPEGRTTCTPEANDVHPRGEPGAPLEANPVRPIRPGSVLDPSGTRDRAFAGVRLRVSRRQHQLVLDEFGSQAHSLDLFALYASWDAELVASGAAFDTLAYVKQRLGERIRAGRAAGPVYSADFANWCQHDPPCHNRSWHLVVCAREREATERRRA